MTGPGISIIWSNLDVRAAWRDEEFLEIASDIWGPLEERIRSFEAALAAGGRPSLTEYLPAEDPSHGQLLLELVHADLEFRISGGEQARVEEYLRRFPELASRPAVVKSLIAAEFEHRLPREPGLARSSYLRRFPQWAGELSAWISAIDRRAATVVDDGQTDADRRPPRFHAEENGQPLPHVPGYQLIEEISRGGMGIVYKAVETRLNRLVAVKTVRPGAEALERERLRREAEAAASLQHPNVVEVHCVFEESGRLYVVSEYLAGGTLGKLAAGHPLSARETVRLLEPIARAVGVAHARGLIHRDLKPSNILIASDGTPKVADFGLAKRLDDDSDLTRTGVVAGSPAYMAPEQATADREIGAAADVWALGVILYELLTGRPPFQAAGTLDTLEQLRRDEPVPPRKLVPRLPRDLETICLRCLEKRPEKRYASAAVLADELVRFRDGKPVHARPIGRVERAARWMRRRPLAAVLLALLLLAAAVGTAGLAAYAAQLDRLNSRLKETIGDRNEALSAETDARANADAARRRAEASERTARHLLFVADMRQASEAVRDGDLVSARELLDEHLDQATGPYAFLWNHIDRLIHSPGQVIDTLGGAAYFVCFSPDGSTLAACGAPGEIRLYDTDGWKPRGRLSAGGTELNGLAFSPDGRRLASVGDDGHLVLWDLATREPVWRKKLYDAPAYQVAFGLDGTVLAACGVHRDVILVDAATAAEIDRLPADNDFVEGIAATPDGRLLITAGRRGRAIAWDLETRAIRWTYDPAPGMLRLMSVAISPDGRLAAFGVAGSAPVLIEVETGRFYQGPLPGGSLDTDASWFRSIAFASSGEILAVAGDAGTVHLTGISKKAFTSDEEPQPFVPLTDQSRTGWFAHADRIGCLAASRNVIVTASRDGTIAAWQPAERPPWAVVDLHTWCRNMALLPAPASGNRPAQIIGSNNGEMLEPVSVRWIDGETGLQTIIAGDDVSWWDVEASSDGRRMFATGNAGEFVGWATGGTSARELFRRKLPSDRPVGLGAVTSDGRRVVVDYWPINEGEHPDTEVAVLDGMTGETQVARRFPENTPDAALTSDGSSVAVGQWSEILLLDPTSLATRRTLAGHRADVSGITFSSDGRRLASAGKDREVIVWDVLTGRPIHRWQADAGEIESIAFAGNGKMLLTSTDKRPPRLWDVETGRMLLEPGSTPRTAGIEHWGFAALSAGDEQIVAGRGHAIVLIDGRPRSQKAPTSH